MTPRLPAAAAALLSCLCAHVQAATAWTMSSEQSDANYLTQNARQFADDVKAASGGRLELKVQSNSVLLKRPEVKRGVQQGIVARERTGVLTQTLANKGIKVQPIPAAIAPDLLRIGHTMADEWLKRAGPDGAKLLETYRQ